MTRRKFARQGGAALITGLVFLAIMTILGVSAMRSATLSERMARNAMLDSLAFQAAESSLRVAEERLRTNFGRNAASVSLVNGGKLTNVPVELGDSRVRGSYSAERIMETDVAAGSGIGSVTTYRLHIVAVGEVVQGGSTVLATATTEAGMNIQGPASH